MNLTGEQIRAIETLDGNLQIIACAGSGKTQVVSARVVEILKRKQAGGIKPENIGAFTFTDKAAAELKDCIATLVRREFGDVPGLAQMYVGTIHGCLELRCRRSPSRLGVDGEKNVYRRAVHNQWRLRGLGASYFLIENAGTNCRNEL